MQARQAPAPAAVALYSLGVPQQALADAVGLKRRSIGYQLSGRNRLLPEVVIALRAIVGAQAAEEIESLAYKSWAESHPKAAAKAEAAVAS